MAETQYIADPSQLSGIATRMSMLRVEDDSTGSQEQHVTLALLQPLAQDDVLASCRNPASRVLRNSNGIICGKSNNEFLNIKPLSTAWRQAAKAEAPIARVIFDLTLPNLGDKKTTEFSKIYWDTAVPNGGGVCVITQDAINLAITLATAMTMRMRGSGRLFFGLTFDEAQRPSAVAMGRLEKHLTNLANYASRN